MRAARYFLAGTLFAAAGLALVAIESASLESETDVECSDAGMMRVYAERGREAMLLEADACIAIENARRAR